MPRKRPPFFEKNEFREVIQSAMRVGSRYATLFQSTNNADLAMVPRLVDQILGAHEEETCSKVARTWEELALWADSRDLISSKMNAAEVACFVLDSSAPSPVLVALQFLNKRLYFELDLTLAFDLKKIRKAITGIGQKQAPVAQPILVAKLEGSITQSIRGSGFKRLGFYATWCVATGRVRWVRVQRSRLLRMTETSMVFECLRDKQRQRRCDFFFGVAPGSASSRGLTLVMPFGNALKTMPAFPSSLLPCKAEIPRRVAKSQVAHCLVHEVGPEVLRRTTSKSWRQFSVTWAFLSKIDAAQGFGELERGH